MTAANATRPGSFLADRPMPPRDRPVSMRRLTSVELRKMTDTRAGRWLLLIVAVAGLAAAALSAFAGDRKDHVFDNITQTTAGVLALLVPVFGVLLVTSEWSQRTALTTFTLVPRRGRVVAAKAAAGVVLGLAVAVVTVGLSALATAVAPHLSGADVWNLDGGGLLRVVLYEVLFVLFGVGFGLVFLNSAIAIVVYFVLPTAWTVLTNAVSGLHGVRDWLDASTTLGRLLDPSVSSTQWAQAGVSVAVWIVAPMIIGAIRVRRSAI